MNKRIKVIDLINKIANGEELPKRIKYNGLFYEYKRITQGTGYVTDDYSWLCSDFNIDDWNDLNNEVEIIEDSIEEIEELHLKKDETFEFNERQHQAIVDMQNKINELVRAVNQLKSNLEE